MCDFHNFSLISAGQCTVSLKGNQSMFFEIFSNISKTLILVFEVIVQPPKAHFLTFSSETKIMKITHSAGGHQRVVMTMSVKIDIKCITRRK